MRHRGAVILISRASLGSLIGMRWAVAAISGLFWLGLLILLFAPETRARELTV